MQPARHTHKHSHHTGATSLSSATGALAADAHKAYEPNLRAKPSSLNPNSRRNEPRTESSSAPPPRSWLWARCLPPPHLPAPAGSRAPSGDAARLGAL